MTERGRRSGRGLRRAGAAATVAALLATLTGTLLGPAGAVLDPSGNLDAGFGGDGHSITNFSQVDTFAEARGVAFQTGVHEGEIVLAGGYQDGFDSHLALLRLNPDGTQDTGFGSGGEVKTVVGGNDLAYDVAIQPDNKIVVIGDSDQDFLVARYSPDGVLDDTFGGGDGVVAAGVMAGGFDRAHAVALQPDGKIVVVGYSDVAAGDIRDVSLMRFNPDGSLDPTFGGGDGKATVNLHDTGAERLNDVVIQPDGKIVAAGEARLGDGTCNTVAFPHFDSVVLRVNADGTPDTSFSGDGVFSVNAATVSNCPDDSFEAVALQSDGKIVAAGGAATTADGSTNAKQNISVARLNPDGTLDATFAGDGTAWTAISDTSGYTPDISQDVVVMPDGKIMIGAYTDAGPSGTSNQNFAAVRYLADGNLDSSFAGDGTAVVDFGQNDAMDSMAVDTSGRPVLVGYSFPPGEFDDPLIAATRLTTDGAQDTTFNGTGAFFKPLQGGSVESGAGVAVQRNGANANKVIVAGPTDAGPSIDFGLVRYAANGDLDTSFDGDGTATGDNSGRNDSARAVVVDSDDRIVVAGDSYGTSGAPTMTLMRFSPDGGLDPAFSGDGVVTASMGSNANQWNAVALQPDGRIVVGGTTSNTSSNWDLAFGRYNADGTPDLTFDGDGISTLTLGSGFEEIKALAVQPDGKVVAGGFVFPTTSDSAFAVVRLNPDGSLDTSFDGDGRVTTPIGAGDFPRNEIRSIAVLPDGKIVAGGKGNDGTIGGESSNNVMRLARYNPDGSLDTTFDTDGIVSTNLADDRFDEIGAIAVQYDDKIVAFASTLHLYVSNYDFVLARYNWDDGSLDSTYGADNLGYTLTSLSPGADQAAGGVLLPGGVAVAGGTASSSDMGAARWLGDPPPVLPGAPDLDAGSDSGASATDNLTNDNTPLVVGAAPGCNVGETTIVKVNGALTSPLTRALCRSGNWSLQASALTDGVHTFSAFSRNGFGDTADTATLSLSVDTVAAPPTIASPADGATVQFPPAPSISGTIGETIAGSVVKVMEGPAELCSLPVDGSGSWSCTPDLAEGPHTITARLTDVAGNTSPVSAAVDFTVSKGDTVTELVSSLNPSTFGDDVTLSVAVTSPAGASPGPTGTVDVVVDGSPPQTLTLTDGTATLPLDGLAVGPHAVSATYGGDGNYATSTAGLTQTVDQAGAVVALTSSPNPSMAGEAVTFTATVTPAKAGRPAEPTGEVEFVIDGGAPVKVAMHSPATYTVALDPGNHTVSARYPGDANFAAASADLSGGQVVNALPVAPSPDGSGDGGDIGAGPGGTGTGGTGTGVGTGGTGTDVGGATGTNPGVTGDSLTGDTLPRTGGSSTAALTMLSTVLLGLGATGLVFRRRDEGPR